VPYGLSDASKRGVSRNSPAASDRPLDEWLGRARPVVGQGVFLPISAAARAELVPLALIVVVRVPNVQMKQAPERLHLRSIANIRGPVTGGQIDHLGVGPNSFSAAVPGHPDALVGAALAADTAVRIGGASAVLEVVSPRCRQGGLKRCRPVVVGPGEPPHLV
jgi:hypothetical protein